MIRVGLFGDSQAGGLEPHLRALLPEYGLELVWSEYRNGYTTARYISEGTVAGAPRDLDLAIVVLGGNDTPGANYEETLENAVAVIGGHAKRILWIGPSYSTSTAVEQRHTATRRQQARILPELGVTFRDPLNWQQREAADRAPDGTHFRRDAYELQAEAVALEASTLAGRARATLWALGIAVVTGLGIWASGWWRGRGRRRVATRRRSR